MHTCNPSTFRLESSYFAKTNHFVEKREKWVNQLQVPIKVQVNLLPIIYTGLQFPIIVTKSIAYFPV